MTSSKTLISDLYRVCTHSNRLDEANLMHFVLCVPGANWLNYSRCWLELLNSKTHIRRIELIEPAFEPQFEDEFDAICCDWTGGGWRREPPQLNIISEDELKTASFDWIYNLYRLIWCFRWRIYGCFRLNFHRYVTIIKCSWVMLLNMLLWSLYGSINAYNDV